eukprot:m.238988 g.238988  ORF g.238988 m.238988 type:complete len:512 (-) comp26571_c0_seq8:1867-3402(-)
MTAVVVLVLLSVAVVVRGADSRMNVLFIAIDDMRPELSPYGCSHMHTENMQKLADESLVFDSAHVAVALCSPSRTAFLTSRRPDTSKVWEISNNEYWRKCGGNFTTLPQHFKENGYLTLGTGKIFHHGPPSGNMDVKYSWSPECLPYQNVFPSPPVKGSPAIHKYNESADEIGDGKLANNAINLLEGIVHNRSTGIDNRPFFLAVGFHRPHIPWRVPKTFYDLYDVNMPIAPNPHLSIDVPDIALQNILKGYWETFTDIKKFNISQGYPDDNSTATVTQAQQLRQAYRAAISFTDRNIGTVLDKLEELNLKNNTVIVLLADHGYQQGDNDQWAKHNNYEQATRVPFMVRLPTQDFKPGRVSSFVETVDIFPTLAEVVLGQKLPQCSTNMTQNRKTLLCTEGTSFAPVLQNPEMQWKKAAFWQYNRQNETVMGYTVRVDGYRYTEWVKFNRTTATPHWDQVLGVELYQHVPNVEKACEWDMEHNNVANLPEFAATRAALSKMLHEGWRPVVP